MEALPFCSAAARAAAQGAVERHAGDAKADVLVDAAVLVVAVLDQARDDGGAIDRVHLVVQLHRARRAVVAEPLRMPLGVILNVHRNVATV